MTELVPMSIKGLMLDPQPHFFQLHVGIQTGQVSIRMLV